MAGWILSWVENDWAGFFLGRNCLRVRVEFGGWILAGGFWLGGFSKSRFRLDDLGGFRLGGFRLGGFWIGGFWIRECCLG